MIKFFELPYTQVIEIYNQYQRIDAENDIAARTRLLQQHPEIFQETVREEVAKISRCADKLAKRL